MSEQPAGGFVSNDTKALMAFEAAKKSAGVSYALWFFLGGLGVHRFYNGKVGSGVGMIALNALGWMTVLAMGLGFLFWLALAVWWLVDAFLISGWVSSHNTALLAKLSGGSSAVAVAAGAV